MILVLDNYDSFTYNLVQYMGELGATMRVARNDALTVDDVEALAPEAIVISPGPGNPDGAGISLGLIERFHARVPILGVCLGHQAIGAAYGAVIERAPELLHGKTSLVHHTGAGVLAGLPDPFTATRYHSLAVLPETLPGEIEVTGRTESGVVMAMRHRTLPIEGVQFHPESVLTEGGHTMLATWLASCGLPSALEKAPPLAAEVETRRLAAFATA
jgi:para-aminobenzoate synthetase component 2